MRRRAFHPQCESSALAARAVGAAALLLAAGLCVPPAGADDPGEAVLRVGSSGDYAPFSVRTDSGLSGFDVALARRYAEDRGLDPQWVPFRWPDLVSALAEHRFDLAASGVTVRRERSLAGRFSVPVATSGALVLVREGARFSDPAELDAAWVRLAVNAGGHLEQVARARFPSATLLAIQENEQVIEELAAGRVDGAVTDTLEAPGWEDRVPGLRRIGPLTRDRKAWLLPRESLARAADVDRWLLAREADGTLAALRREWLGPDTQPAAAAPRAALLAAIDERLDLMPLVAEAKRVSGAAVRDRAREERVIEEGLQAVAGAARAAGVEPPPRPAVRSFYRAQIEAAVAVQEAVLAGPALRAGPVRDLERSLRPAILRVGERMALLLVHLPGAAVAAGVRAAVDRELADHPLGDPQRAALAAAIRAFHPGNEVGNQASAPRDGPGQEPGEDGDDQ